MNPNSNQGRNRPATSFEKLIGWPFLVFVCVLFVYFLTACTVIGHKPPPSDWPTLKVEVKDVGFWEGNELCGNGGLMPLLWQVSGCAYVNFDTMTCTVYLMVTGEGRELTLEHELDHCKGKDHMGSSALADYWNEWKKTNRYVAVK